MTPAEPEQFTQDVFITVLRIVGLILALIGVIAVLKKLYLRQKFTKPGFGLRHIGFQGEVPLSQVVKAVKNDEPSHIFRSNEWTYIGYDTIDDLYSIVGIDPYRKPEFVSVAYRSKQAIQVTLIERYPNPERIHDGFFAAALNGEYDHLVNFVCPMYRIYQSIDFPKSGLARLALYPFRIRVFQSKEQIKNFKLIYSLDQPKSIHGVSSGIYNVWDILGRNEQKNKALAYACGKVLSCEKHRNAVTGRTYYVATIDTEIGLLEIPSKRRAYWRLPQKGEYMAVEGELTGYIEQWCDSDE